MDRSLDEDIKAVTYSRDFQRQRTTTKPISVEQSIEDEFERKMYESDHIKDLQIDTIQHDSGSKRVPELMRELY